MSPPIADIITRVTHEDTEIAGTFIPKGTRGTIDVYNLHHNPTVWKVCMLTYAWYCNLTYDLKDPETFRPERFEPGGEAENLAGLGMSWLPFSNGQRQCIGIWQEKWLKGALDEDIDNAFKCIIGMNFSLAEQRVFLPMLCKCKKGEHPTPNVY